MSKPLDDGPSKTSSHPASPGKAITTPFWDGFLTGGLSLVAMSCLLVHRLLSEDSFSFRERDWIALTLLVNSPHFMASYRVLYDSKNSLRHHPWASFVVPCGLASLLVAIGIAEDPAPLMNALTLLSSVYLAWHYAGQTWGMVATFSYLANVRYEPNETWLLRSGPRCLITIHVLFALSGRLPPRDWVQPTQYLTAYSWVFVLACGAAGLSFVAGLWAFARARRRGQPLPLRAVLPWASLYLWYPFWYFIPGGFMWVQLSHALQYLAFPTRVEVNRFDAKCSTRNEPAGFSRRLARAALTYLSFVVAGALFLHGPPLVTHALGEGWWSTAWVRQMLIALTLCVGIHHYFVDGAIWHLRNESVRQSLFSHLNRGGRASTG